MEVQKNLKNLKIYRSVYFRIFRIFLNFHLISPVGSIFLIMSSALQCMCMHSISIEYFIVPL